VPGAGCTGACRERMGTDDDARRFQAAAEVAGIDGVDGQAGQAAAEAERLPPARVVERNVRDALDAPFGVPVGFAVADQQQAHAGPPHQKKKSSTGDRRWSRANASRRSQSGWAAVRRRSSHFAARSITRQSHMRHSWMQFSAARLSGLPQTRDDSALANFPIFCIHSFTELCSIVSGARHKAPSGQWYRMLALWASAREKTRR